MSDRPTCRTCPYFACEGFEEDGSVGECHRHAPRPTLVTIDQCEDDLDDPLRVIVAFPQIRSQSHFPQLDFCGEHPDFPAYIAELKRLRRPTGDDRPIPLENFGVRARKALDQLGVKTIADIKRVSEADVLKVHDVGFTTAREIWQNMRELGVDLWPEYES